MRRNTFDLIYTQPLRFGTLTAKGVMSTFKRQAVTSSTDFAAKQLSYYSELSYLLPLRRHAVVVGVNANGEALRPDESSPTPLQNRYTFSTLGLFVQDNWTLTPTTTIEAGLRTDHHNRYGNFLLPRVALLQKIGKEFVVRVNGGAGYRAVVPYVNELDERDLSRITTLTTNAEKSLGGGGDITWKHSLGEEGTLTISQGFFYTRLANPAIVVGDNQEAGGTSPLAWQNQSAPLLSRGLESYVRYSGDGTELYLGYQYTYARRLYDAVHPNVELAARHKLAAVFVKEVSHHLGLGIEAAYTGTQYLSDGRQTPGYPFVAGMVRYKQGPFTVVLNGENFFDYRQTRKEAVVFAPRNNPGFAQIWSPVEGRVINLSVTYRWVGR
jgi:outer membrane receptor for ferrienterochelin and colicin